MKSHLFRRWLFRVPPGVWQEIYKHSAKERYETFKTGYADNGYGIFCHFLWK